MLKAVNFSSQHEDNTVCTDYTHSAIAGDQTYIPIIGTIYL